MGAPGYTTFCSKGHIVLAIAHHHVCMESPTQCDHCGSKELRTETEWGDDDYGPFLVPYEPVDSKWHDVDNDRIQGRVRVDIYDVSRLFEQEGSWGSSN